MKKVILLMAIVGIFTSLSFADEDSQWEYKKGEGYINKERSEKMGEDDFFKYGQAIMQKGESAKEKNQSDQVYANFAEAVEVFELLSKYAIEKKIKEDSQFARADAYFNISDYEKAYDNYESFIGIYRESPRTRDAIRKEMDSAVLLAQKGVPQTLLGVTIGTSANTGLDMLKDALARYPYEEFSADYQMWLADYYYGERDYEAAVAQYKYIFDNYKQSEAGAEALYKLAVCSLKDVQRADRDTDFLKDAKRYLDRLVELYPESGVTPKAQQVLDGINEKLAECDYKTGEFYLQKDKIVSAAFYYHLVLKYYKDTTWAEKATKRLKEIQGELAELEEVR